ncbi:MAG TPA: hypothetical protein DCQ84_14005 [Candidatus Competibacteraceae bacterium]|nr:hypothetical protein [Candidatus Competibacteraceae bacterium]
MAVTVENRAYIGKGKILIRKRGAIATPFRYIGATSKLDLAIATEKKELPNLETVGGGNLITLERVKSLTGSTEGYNFSAENLSLALRAGLSDDAAGAAITGEKHIALAGSLVPFAHLPDLAGEMTAVIDVTAARANTTAYAKGATILASSVIYQATTAGTSGAAPPTFNATVGDTTTDGTVVWTSRGAAAMAEDTDYVKSAVGLSIVSERFVLGLPVSVGYTQSAARYVELLTSSGDEYELFFEGLNELRNGAAAPVRLYVVKFSPTSGLGLKGDDFGKLTLNFDALPDQTIVGLGLSQYGKIGVSG